MLALDSASAEGHLPVMTECDRRFSPSDGGHFFSNFSTTTTTTEQTDYKCSVRPSILQHTPIYFTV
ncbi:hypothetical protein T08_2348 [Trichinella sp. T8]|nr:hypothetical protein T08_2348 [Trichinella sp. T8]